MRSRRRPSIADLVADGRIESVQPGSEEANDLVDHALAHLESARLIRRQDPAGAYQLLYDAARKAIAADMLVNGYRTKSDRPGAHAAVVAYAEEALAGHAPAVALTSLDQMRRNRNRTEYGGLTVGVAQVESDLETAAAIVGAVRDRLPTSDA